MPSPALPRNTLTLISRLAVADCPIDRTPASSARPDRHMMWGSNKIAEQREIGLYGRVDAELPRTRSQFGCGRRVVEHVRDRFRHPRMIAYRNERAVPAMTQDFARPGRAVRADDGT